MSNAVKQMTVEDEFALYYANIADPKYEIVDGKIVMQAVPSVVHSVISNNFNILISNHLDSKGSKCIVFHEKGCVKIPNKFSEKTGEQLGYEPDVLVDCRYTGKGYSENPTLIVEVLSTNRKVDIVDKFETYKQYDSLQEYVVVDQYSVEVRVYRKKNNWTAECYFLGDTIFLESIGLEFEIEKIYKRTIMDESGHIRIQLSYDWLNGKVKIQPK